MACSPGVGSATEPAQFGRYGQSDGATATILLERVQGETVVEVFADDKRQGASIRLDPQAAAAYSRQILAMAAAPPGLGGREDVLIFDRASGLYAMLARWDAGTFLLTVQGPRITIVVQLTSVTEFAEALAAAAESAST